MHIVDERYVFGVDDDICFVVTLVPVNMERGVQLELVKESEATRTSFL